jgi:dihydropteroate synthase
MRGTPETMQQNPHFDDVLGEVAIELGVSLAAARAAGIPNERLAVDPGIGFGKRLEDNLELLANAGSLGEALGLPVLVGPSRKRFLGDLTGDPVECRDAATAAACAVAVFAGADAVRVHDVAGAVRAAAVASALRDARREAIA